MTCEKSGHCYPQTLAQQFGVRRIRFEDTRERHEIDNTSPASCAIRTSGSLPRRLCARARRCRAGHPELCLSQQRTGRACVRPQMAQTKCVSCGHAPPCAPPAPITVKNQIGEAWRAIHDLKKRVVIQIAPAVRVAVGEALASLPVKTCLISSSRRSSLFAWAWTRARHDFRRGLHE